MLTCLSGVTNPLPPVTIIRSLAGGVWKKYIYFFWLFGCDNPTYNLSLFVFREIWYCVVCFGGFKSTGLDLLLLASPSLWFRISKEFAG